MKCGFFLICVHPKCWGRLPSKLVKRELFVRSYLEFRRFAKETYQKEMTTRVKLRSDGVKCFCFWLLAGIRPYFLLVPPPWQPFVALITWGPR